MRHGVPFELAKRTAGAPLTEAEHQQRVDAARSRWMAGALGVGTAAAVAAGVASAIRIKRQRTADSAEVRRAAQGVRDVRTANLRRTERFSTAAAAIDAGLAPTGGGKFLRRAGKTMQSQVRRADLETDRHFADTAETRITGLTDEGHPIEERLSADIEGMAVRREDALRQKVRLTDLRENGRASRTVPTEAAVVHPVAAYTRTIRAGMRPNWEKLAGAKLAHLMEAFGMAPPEEAGSATPPASPPGTPAAAPTPAGRAAAESTAANPFGNIGQSPLSTARTQLHETWKNALHDGIRTLSGADQGVAMALPPKQREKFLSEKLGLTEPPRPLPGAGPTKKERTAAEREAVRERVDARRAQELADRRASLSPARQAQFDRVQAARAVREVERQALRPVNDPLADYKQLVDYVRSDGHRSGFGPDGYNESGAPAPHETAADIRQVLGNIRGLDDIERLTHGMSARGRNAFLDLHLLPHFTLTQAYRDIEVAAAPMRGRAAGTHREPGYPDAATRQALAAELRRDVAARADTWSAAEAKTAAWRRSAAGEVARQAAFKPARRLALLNQRGRIGLIGGVAALAGLGGYAAVRGVQAALGKRARPGEAPGGPRTDFAQKGDPPRVTMLIGMPGAGKSTWRAMRMAQAAIRPTTVISTDDKVEDIGRQRGLSFSEAFKLLDHKEVDRDHQAALRVAIRAGHDVVIDRVNASPGGRAKWLRRVPAHYETHAVVFHVPEGELSRRRSRRAGKVIPGHALAEMRAAYRPPAIGEFDFVHRVRSEIAPRFARGQVLAKAAPGSTPAHPLAAADAAEAEMAQRLATMFGHWADTAGEKLTGGKPGTLLGGMAADLDEAFQPLDAAARAGAGVPVLTGEGGRTIAFSFLARDPKVTAYIDRYRKDKIAELVDEQRAAIKAQLIDAAKSGASPDAMARRIRETIGLTASQMQHVQNYRTELETLQAGALTRELRDRRFDSPITRALATGTAIAADKVDQYVDAYHRRYLAFRAMTIARTEGVGAANNGQAAAAAILVASQPGMEVEKTWMTQIDGHEREDHHELNGKTVLGLDTPFVCLSGDQVRWPHDPLAPARAVIRCRCSWVTRLVPTPESPDSAAPANDEASP